MKLELGTVYGADKVDQTARATKTGILDTFKTHGTKPWREIHSWG